MPRTRTSSLLRRPALSAVLLFIAALALVAQYKRPVAANATAAVTSAGACQSGPIALTPDNQLLVNVNPEANSVTFFNAATNPPVKLAEVAVGRDPSSVANQPNNANAFVTNAGDGTVSIINRITFSAFNTFNVGAEPMAIAFAPNGSRFYVANSASNNLMVFNPALNPPALVATIDLSAFGTAPRAISVTNDGDADDTDETIFVALFFGQLAPGKSAVDEGQDDQREGRVVAISAATNTVLAGPNPITLAPLANTGFNSNGRLAPGTGLVPAVASVNPQTFTTPTGAFPNQLAAIAIQPGQSRAYVVSTGASPNGPLRFNQMAQGLVSVFNTGTRLEVAVNQTDPIVRRTAPLNLNQGINLATTPMPRLFMTNPVAMAWRPDGSDAWVVVQNSDLIVRLTVDANGVPTIGAPLVAGPSQIVRVDLVDPPAGLIPGKAPRGIAISNDGNRAFVSNFVSRSVTVVNISNPTAPIIAGTVQSSPLPTPGTTDAVAQLGAELFYTGRGPQERMSNESWGGCIVCHPHGRSDNVTWMFDAGPRQTVPLDGMFDKNNPNDQRLLNWSAVRDENHDFELNTRGVFGGRGLIDDDRLFLAIGGTNGATPTESALLEQFNNAVTNAAASVTTTNDLAEGMPLPNLTNYTPRRDFGIATLEDNRVYIIGGRTGPGQGTLVTGADAIVEFNPRTNTLTRRNPTGFTPRHSLGAAAVKTSGGLRIYAVGGYNNTSDLSLPVGTTQEYNPATDTWRTVAALMMPTAQFGITVAGGVNTADPLQLIHVVSGNTDSESTPISFNNVQRFRADPSGPGDWTNFNVTGLTPRRNHGAATALRGVGSRIFVIGGQNNAGTVLDTVEEYTNLAVPSPVLTPHTSLPAPRARFGIGSTLTTNQIYVIGGVDGANADQTTVFEYTIAANPALPGVPGPTGAPSGNWVTRGNLSSARRSLGVTTPPGVTNFLPAKNTGRDARQDAIAVWVARNVRSSRPPVSPTDIDAQAGSVLFNTVGLVQSGFSCATCHGGPKFTRSTVDYAGPPSPEVGIGLGNERVIGAELRQTLTQGPNVGQFPGVLINVGTFTLAGGRVNELRFNGADISQAINPLGANGFNIPSLLSVDETAPYFYSGLAQTLNQVFDGSQDTFGGVQHHFVINPAQRAQLISFLKSIKPACATITVNPPMLANGFIGVAYNQALTQSGGGGATIFSVSAGALPNGLTLSGEGVLSGMPTVTGSFNFTARATDVSGCTGERQYTVIISGNGLQFYPLARPLRLLDTRADQSLCDNIGVPITGGTSINVQARITCQSITIPATAQAIVGNITAINQTASFGFLTVFPAGQTLPLAANMIYEPGQLLSNNFTVGLNANGEFSVFGERTIHVVIDVSGYFAPPTPTGLFYHGLPRPLRVLDTRADQSLCDNVGAPIAAMTSLTTQARISCDGLTIPPGAQAIAGNATVINQTASFGFLTIFPSGQPLPLAANMIYAPGQLLANAFTVGLNANGQFDIFGERTIHMVIDVAGYYSTEAVDANGVGLLFSPLSRPLRLLDTRPDQSLCDNVGTPIPAGTWVTTQARITCQGITIPTTAQTIIGNVTAINQTNLFGYLTLYPTGQPPPLAANMIYAPGGLLSNAFFTGLSAGGEFNFFSERVIHGVVDVSGYFAP